MAKNPLASVGDTGDMGLTPGLGRFPGRMNGNLLQYSGLENSMDKGVTVAYSPWGRKESDMAEHACKYMYLLFSWRRKWQPTPVLLPGKSHGGRSLVGYSPWGRKESDTTERLHFLFSFSCIGEGNGNPLQCSCLENPRDSRAWWAAVYGAA